MKQRHKKFANSTTTITCKKKLINLIKKKIELKFDCQTAINNIANVSSVKKSCVNPKNIKTAWNRVGLHAYTKTLFFIFFEKKKLKKKFLKKIEKKNNKRSKNCNCERSDE